LWQSITISLGNIIMWVSLTLKYEVLIAYQIGSLDAFSPDYSDGFNSITEYLNNNFIKLLHNYILYNHKISQ